MSVVFDLNDVRARWRFSRYMLFKNGPEEKRTRVTVDDIEDEDGLVFGTYLDAYYGRAFYVCNKKAYEVPKLRAETVAVFKESLGTWQYIGHLNTDGYLGGGLAAGDVLLFLSDIGDEQPTPVRYLPMAYSPKGIYKLKEEGPAMNKVVQGCSLEAITDVDPFELAKL